MRVRLPSSSVPLLVLLAVGLLATAPAAAADDGPLNATSPDVDPFDEGNESNLSSSEKVSDLRTVTAEQLNRSTDQDVADTLPQVASDALTEETLSDDDGHDVADTLPQVASDALTEERVSDDGEHDVEGNQTREENDTAYWRLTDSVGEVATVFTTSRVVSYVEARTGLGITAGDPMTRQEDPPATRAGESEGTGQSETVNAPARRSGGSPEPLPPGGLALSAGTGVLMLAAITRQSVLSGMSAGPALAVVAPMGLTTEAVDRVLRVFAPFRYSRFDDSDPLDHDRRREVFGVIEEKPGTYLSEVSEAADVPLSTARHHVRVLEREDLVASAKVRGKRRFYPDGIEKVELAAAMDDEPTAAVLDALARLGPSSVATIADELGRDSSTVTHHLQRLDDDGLVERERDGRTVINRLTPAACQVLEHEPAGAGATVVPADD